MDKPQILTHLEKETDITMFDCKWIPCSSRFITLGSELDGKGNLAVYSFDSKSIQQLTSTQISKSFKCGTFDASSIEERKLVTGDFDGNLMTWDLENLKSPLSKIGAHSEIINCIDGLGGIEGNGTPEVVTGSRDGSVKVWDLRVKDRPVACMQPKHSEKRRDCWSVQFGNSYNDTERSVMAGYDNGDVKLFDLKTMSLFWETTVPNGICSLQFDRRDIEMNKLIVAGLEGKFHFFDLRTHHPTKGFANGSAKHDKSTTLWSVRHLPQIRDTFIVTSGSGNVALYNYIYPEKRWKEDDNKIKEGVVGKVKKFKKPCLATSQLIPSNGLKISSDWEYVPRLIRKFV